jgi:hypothetical protein
MYILEFGWILCFVLSGVGVLFICMSMLSNNTAQAWHWGINSLIATAIPAIVIYELQKLLIEHCAIQHPPLLYLVHYLPQLLFLPVCFYVGRAKRFKEKDDQVGTFLNLFFAYIYLSLVALIPFTNLILGIRFNLRQ